MRLRRGRRPLIVGARSVHVGIKPNDDPAREVTAPEATGRLLEWLVFDALKCDPGTAHVRDLVSFHGGGLLDARATEEAAADRAAGRVGTRTGGRREPDVADLVARIGDAADDDELREVWAEANRAALLQAEVPTPGGSYTVAELIQARHEQFLAASMKGRPRRSAQGRGDLDAARAGDPGRGGGVRPGRCRGRPPVHRPGGGAGEPAAGGLADPGRPGGAPAQRGPPGRAGQPGVPRRDQRADRRPLRPARRAGGDQAADRTRARRHRHQRAAGRQQEIVA
jgi:hypothetical protein